MLVSNFFIRFYAIFKLIWLKRLLIYQINIQTIKKIKWNLQFYILFFFLLHLINLLCSHLLFIKCWVIIQNIVMSSKVWLEEGKVLTWLPKTIFWNSSRSFCNLSIWDLKAAVALASYSSNLLRNQRKKLLNYFSIDLSIMNTMDKPF